MTSSSVIIRISSLFWGITQRVLIVGTDVWGQSVGTISKGYLVMFDT